jgi:hypothetical protein
LGNIGIIGNHVELVYHDDYENGAGLGAALVSILEKDDKIFGIISAAMLTAIESKEKHISKTPKKAVKPQPSKKVAAKRK